MSEIVNVEPGASLAKSTMLRPVARPAEIIEVHKEAVALIQQALESGRDYGVIPGTGEKPTLLKAGAERLLGAFDLYADVTIIEQEVDHGHVNDYISKKWETLKKPSQSICEEMKAAGTGRFKKGNDGWLWQEYQIESGTSFGLYRFVVRTELKMRSTDRIVGVGVGSCSSMETKYIRAPRDYENTVLKMAKKRSLIDATLSSLALSDRFTQDVEDMREVLASEEQQPVQRDFRPAADDPKAIRAWMHLTSDDDDTIKDLAADRGLKYSEVLMKGFAAGQRNFDELAAWLARLPLPEFVGSAEGGSNSAIEVAAPEEEFPLEPTKAEKVFHAMTAKERVTFKAKCKPREPIEVIEAFLASGATPFFANLLEFASREQAVLA